jgi:leucyl aminopeptidase
MKLKNIVEKEYLEKALRDFEEDYYTKSEINRLKNQLKSHLKSVVIVETCIESEKSKLLANAAISEAIRELLDLPAHEKEPEQLEMELK